VATAAQISEAVALILESVTGIGKVNRYDRFFTDETGFREFHTAEIAGRRLIASASVTISGLAPEAVKETRDGSSYSQTKRRTVEIKIIRGQEDASASQHTLADLADAVYDAFDASSARTALAALGYVYSPPEATVGIAGYGNPPFVLVNQAVITLKLDEVLS
jgi:hypothetical protein